MHKHGIAHKISQGDSELNQNLITSHRPKIQLMSQIDQALHTAKTLKSRGLCSIIYNDLQYNHTFIKVIIPAVARMQEKRYKANK
jgi:hypothetical protein